MKTDEVQERLISIFEYVQNNLQKILLAVGIVLLAGAGIFGFRQMAESRELKAQASLDEALEAFRAPVDVESPDGITSDEIRRSRAQAAFDAVRSQHGGSKASEIADVYLGLLAAESGDIEAAKTSWSAYASRNSGDLLAVELQLNLLSARRDSGDGASVASELEAMVDSDRAAFPQDVVLGELATTLTALGRGEEAKALYDRILDEYPESPYTTEARRQAS